MLLSCVWTNINYFIFNCMLFGAGSLRLQTCNYNQRHRFNQMSMFSEYEYGTESWGKVSSEAEHTIRFHSKC